MRSQALPAHEILTPEHPYRRALGAGVSLRRQLAAVAAFLALVGTFAYPSVARVTALEGCGAFVELILACGLAAQVSTRHRLARELIIERGTADIAELREDAQRLLSRSHRMRLAHQLGAALDAALSWDRLLVASRPPPSVRHLARDDRLVRGIIRSLETESENVRAVALADRLLEGCYGSALYQSDHVRLHADLVAVAYAFRAAPFQPPQDR